LHAEEGAADIGGDAEVEPGRVDVGQWRRQRPAGGVVERRVEPPERGDRRLGQLTAGIFICHIGPDGDGPPPGRLDALGHRLQRRDATGAEDDGGTGGGERLGGGRPDAPAGPCDQGNPALERLITHVSSFLPLPAPLKVSYRTIRYQTFRGSMHGGWGPAGVCPPRGRSSRVPGGAGRARRPGRRAGGGGAAAGRGGTRGGGGPPPRPPGAPGGGGGP